MDKPGASDEPFKQGPRNRLRRAAGAAALLVGSVPPKAREVTSDRAIPPSKQGPRNRLSRAAGAAAPSGGSAVHEVTSVGATFYWPVRVYWEDTDAGGIVFYANYLKFFERSRTEWLRSLGIEQQRLRKSSGGMFVVSETNVRYLRSARLDDELIVTARLVEAGRASLIIEQQVLLKVEQSASTFPAPQPAILCEGKIRIGWVDSSTLQPKRIPASILDGLKT